jgi:cell division protein FtsI/penicillin-binding protein 2
LFEGRIRWILAALAGLWFVFLCRVFYLQTSWAEEARETVSRRTEEEVAVPPRRGAILDAEGAVLARDEVGFDLLADPWGLGAMEWECEGCGRVVRTYESDPGGGPGDPPPGPAPQPPDCTCSLPGREWVPTYAVDRLALAGLLGAEPEDLGREIDALRREGWEEARKAAEGRDARWRRLVLRDRLARPRLLRRDVGRDAAMEVILNPERYPGLRAEPRSRRLATPGLDAATRALVGTTGPVLDFDLAARGAELGAEGLTPARLAQMRLGRTGIERTFDRRLRGSWGRERIHRDLEGRVGGREAVAPVQDGEDVRLTLSADLDAAAESFLDGHRGALVAMDPRTGALLALAGTGGLEDGEALPAVSGLVPGSVLKAFTALVAEEGGVAPRAGEIQCLGRRSKPIACEHEHGAPGLLEALAGSCNAYFAATAQRIGVRPLEDYARRIHIDKPYRIGVSREGGGTDWTQEKFRVPWDRTDLANLGIGQSKVLLSPLQVGAIFALVANGGRPVRPFLVEGQGAPPEEPVFSAETVAAVRAGLEETVRSGTAAQAGLDRFRAAGKTGTAQVPGHGGLKRGVWNAWFACYAPAEAPRIVVVVVLEDCPESGGRAAAPIAARFLAAWEDREASRR